MTGHPDNLSAAQKRTLQALSETYRTPQEIGARRVTLDILWNRGLCKRMSTTGADRTLVFLYCWPWYRKR